MNPLKQSDALPAAAGSVFFVLLRDFNWERTPYSSKSFPFCLGFLILCTAVGLSRLKPVTSAIPVKSFPPGRLLLLFLCTYVWTAGLFAWSDYNLASLHAGMKLEDIYEIKAVLKGDGRDIGEGRLAVRADLISAKGKDFILHAEGESLMIMDKNLKNIGWGSILQAEGSFCRSRESSGWIFYCKRVVLSGWSSNILRIRKHVLECLYRELQPLKPDSRSFISALLLGFTPDRGSPLVRFFRNAGSLHLLALSGFHLGLIAFALRFLIQPFGGLYAATALSTLGAIAFLFLVGIRPSLVRAVMMYALWAWHTLRHRRIKALQILSWVFILQLSFYPETVPELSFQLSYAALFGILIGGRNLMFLFRRQNRALPAGILAAGIGAQLTTLPLIVESFGIWRPVGILAAPILTPMVTASMGFGSLLLCGMWLPDSVTGVFTGLLEKTLSVTSLLSSIFNKVPGLAIPGYVAWLTALGGTIIPLYLLRRIHREPHISPQPRFPCLNPSFPGKPRPRSEEALGAELPYKQRSKRKNRPSARIGTEAQCLGNRSRTWSHERKHSSIRRSAQSL